MRRGQADDQGRCVCEFSSETRCNFSWLDPTIPEALSSGLSAEEQTEAEEPTSPKIPPSRRRNYEKRALDYEPAEGERLFCPEAIQSGLLLLRPEGSFAYVHDFRARFSEGVGGQWAQSSDSAVVLEPSSVGYSYAESFDVTEIVGSSHTIVLSDQRGENGRALCFLTGDLLHWFSWLNPTLPEMQDGAGIDCKFGGEVAVDDAEPTSPKVPSRKRRNKEPRSCAYLPSDGERLYCPDSCPAALLLLRPDRTFAYVHDQRARFSEGVTGDWSPRADGGEATLHPKGFGYCYQESFDTGEIVSVSHTVTVRPEHTDDRGRSICILPAECAVRFSWLNPTLPEG